MLLSYVLFISVIFSGFSYLLAENAKNVILVIAKGMSSEKMTEARIKEANSTGSNSSHQLSFEGIPCRHSLKVLMVGQNGSGPSSASALFKGNHNKVNSSCLRLVDYVDNIINYAAQKNNKSTGLVTTMKLAISLPATSYRISNGSGVSECHDFVQNNCTDGSDILISQGHISSRMDVIFGNGRGILVEGNGSICYKNDSRNLVDEWKSFDPNRKIVDSAEEFISHNITRGEKVFGMFSDSDLRNNTEVKSLNGVVDKTLDILKYNKNGYFLVVIVDDVNVVETILKVSELVKYLRDAISNETQLIITSDNVFEITESGINLVVPYCVPGNGKSIDDLAVLGSRRMEHNISQNKQNNQILRKSEVIKSDVFEDAIKQGLAEVDKMAKEFYKIFFQGD